VAGTSFALVGAGGLGGVIGPIAVGDRTGKVRLMRRVLHAVFVVVSSYAALVGCAGDETSGVVPRSSKVSGPDQGNATTDPGSVTAPTGACAGVADAKQISDDANAGDLRITDGALFYRAGTKVMRAAFDGSGQVPVYEAGKLVRSFVGGGLVLTLEDPNNDKAIIKVTSLEEPAGADLLEPAAAEIATTMNAAGSYFVGADADAVYLVGDEEQGEVIYKIAKAAPALEALVTVTEGISSAQVASDGLWYVRDRSRIFRIPVATLDPNNPELKVQGEVREVFGSMDTTCALAVGADAAFCSVGVAVERRDLKGANPRTLFEANKSKVAAPFGGPTWFDGTLYVRTATPDATHGHAIRALRAANGTVEEKVVACGRTAGIGDLAVDEDVVAWTQPDKGVFVAPR
jgi:hypothetical protein